MANLQETESETVYVKQKQYKRNNKTIAQLKILRDFKCQICGTKIKKKNGEFYIEAAHIIPKREKGCEVPKNILILCPNHHKEFDFGDRSIIHHTEKEIEFYQKQLKTTQELGDKSGISIAVGNMAIVYHKQGNYEKAMECYERAIEIAYDLNLKQYLPYHFFGEANSLYQMQQYDKAKECIKECYNAAKEIDDKEHILSSNILKEKINFKLSENPSIKLKSIQNKKNMLEAEKKEENIANLNYEIALMLHKLKKDNSEYKKKAISIFKKLYKKTPKVDYKNKIEELEKLR